MEEELLCSTLAKVDVATLETEMTDWVYLLGLCMHYDQ